jgi:hypothetical protein
VMIAHWYRSARRRSRRGCLLSALYVLVMCTSGCLDAPRLNARCEWTGDSAFPIDMSRREHRAHLMADVRTAEENAIRYGDATVRQRRIGLESWDSLTYPCLERLYGKIASAHGVTRSSIQSAAGMRDWWADTFLVWLPSALIFVVAVHALLKRILGSSPRDDSNWARIAMLIWLGLSVSAVSVGLAHFWGWVVLERRLRTNHLSFRARYLPIGSYVWQAYAAALVLFTLVAAHRLRASRRRESAAPLRRSIDAWKR